MTTPGRPSDSACTSRTACPGSGASIRLRMAMASLRRARKKSVEMCWRSAKSQTRATMRDCGLYAAQPRDWPSRERTSTVAPLSAAPSSRCTAPENIHGCRRSSDFSLPLLRISFAIYHAPRPSLLSRLIPRAGVGGIVGFREVLKIEVGIDLSGRDAGVPEHLLNSAQVAARLQQMRGERVTQHVRMDVLRDALTNRPARHATLHCAGAQRATPLVYEQRVLVRGGDLRAFAQPHLQRFAGESADRYNPRLVSLSQHTYRVVGKIDVAYLQRCELGQAQARRIEQFQYGTIAHRERLVPG